MPRSHARGANALCLDIHACRLRAALPAARPRQPPDRRLPRIPRRRPLPPKQRRRRTPPQSHPRHPSKGSSATSRRTAARRRSMRPAPSATPRANSGAAPSSPIGGGGPYIPSSGPCAPQCPTTTREGWTSRSTWMWWPISSASTDTKPDRRNWPPTLRCARCESLPPAQVRNERKREANGWSGLRRAGSPHLCKGGHGRHRCVTCRDRLA